MPRVFVPHPETGQPVEQEVTYRQVERGELENTVNEKASVLASKQSEVDAHNAKAEALNAELAQAESEHEDAKSTLVSYDAIAPAVVDEGAVGAGSEDENGNEVAEGQY